MRYILAFALAVAAWAAGSVSPAASAEAPASVFITLGTNGGPIPNPKRSEPAHLLIAGDQKILIDAGDGVAEQLGKAGIPLIAIGAVFISHLHFDHTGGLFGLLGMRYQASRPPVLTIYGPPGTKRTVDGLLAAMEPESEVGAGYPGAIRRPPEDVVRVIELGDADKVTLGPITVTARDNTHYSYPAGSAEARRYQSLSYRFDLPDRSIVYTGDTGPSANVEELARGADLLVSEVIDPADALARLKRTNPQLPAAVLAEASRHFAEQHLTPDAVGTLAAKARVKALVLVHNALAGDGSGREAIAMIASKFSGPVTVANDLDRF